ncbi:hypothetical protein ECSTECS1191_4100 [Escherichia coli STEC_S1191]|nr:hypothetical protein ECSTECS1191_4100 [Escherichia coli STEC_S1191]
MVPTSSHVGFLWEPWRLFFVLCGSHQFPQSSHSKTNNNHTDGFIIY